MTGNTEENALRLAMRSETVSSKQSLDMVRALVIYDQNGINLATDFIRTAKARWAELEAKRQEITKPLNLALKNVRELFKDPLGYYAEIESILKSKILDAQRRAQLAQDAALQAAQQAYQVGNMPAMAIATQQAIQAEIVNPQGLQNRGAWTYEVTNIAAVPPQFLVTSVNHEALAAYVRAVKGTVEIPGVRQFEQQTLAVRS